MLDFQMISLALFLVSAFLIMRYTAGNPVPDPEPSTLVICAYYVGGPHPKYLAVGGWEEAVREALKDKRQLMGLFWLSGNLEES